MTGLIGDEAEMQISGWCDHENYTGDSTASTKYKTQHYNAWYLPHVVLGIKYFFPILAKLMTYLLENILTKHLHDNKCRRLIKEKVSNTALYFIIVHYFLRCKQLCLRHFLVRVVPQSAGFIVMCKLHHLVCVLTFCSPKPVWTWSRYELNRRSNAYSNLLWEASQNTKSYKWC